MAFSEELIENLRRDLKEIKKSYEKYKKSCEGNENQTKKTLIDPFIKALGYDDRNPEEVHTEHTADSKKKNEEKVDYAIKKITEKLC